MEDKTDLPMEDDRPEVQVYCIRDGKNYEEFDIGLFRLIERYIDGEETFWIEVRRPKLEELII